MDTDWLADKVVNTSMRIGRKPNPHYERLRKRHRKLLSKDTVKSPTKKEVKLLEKWTDVDYGPLAVKKGKAYRIKKELGHTVVVAFNPATKKLAQAVERQCWKKGAHTFSRELNSKRLKTVYALKPTDAIRELDSVTRAVYSNADYYLNLEAMESVSWKKGIPLSKLMAAKPAAQRISRIRDRNKERWVMVGWPHPQTAKELGIGYARFRKIVFNSIKQSFTKKTYNLVWDYVKLLEGKNHVHVETKDGTDFNFSIKGRKILADDGILSDKDIAIDDVGMNIPCGEVFCAPVETSAEGTLTIPQNIISGYGIAKGIKLEFEKGRVIDYSAKKHEDYLNKFFKANVGEFDRIAELGIGCNSGADFTNGYIVVDEKILGTIHIAIGWNVGYGGKNEASSHLDFIRPMRNGRMFVDGKLAMDKGKIVK